MGEKARTMTNNKDIMLPVGYDYKEDLYCNGEGLLKADLFKGGCRPTHMLLPTTSMTLFGETFNLPAKPVPTLELCYGKNWMVPKAKGLNAVLCQAKCFGGGDVYGE